GSRPARRPHAAAEWLDERGLLVAHALRQPEGRVRDVGGGHADELGEASGGDLAVLECAAHRLAAPPTVVAFAARHVVGGDDAITPSDALDAGSRLQHVAAE